MKMPELANFDKDKIPEVPNSQPGTPSQTESFSNEADRIRFIAVDAQAALARNDIPTVKLLLEQIEDALHALV